MSESVREMLYDGKTHRVRVRQLRPTTKEEKAVGNYPVTGSYLTPYAEHSIEFKGGRDLMRKLENISRAEHSMQEWELTPEEAKEVKKMLDEGTAKPKIEIKPLPDWQPPDWQI